MEDIIMKKALTVVLLILICLVAFASCEKVGS